MKICIILFLFCFSFLRADNIDRLLDIYAKENDLSKKTKKEAAGNVVVYTRQDLERMQVRSLSELLKSIPFFRYNENKLGFTDLYFNKNIALSSNNVRVYINEREFTSPSYGSGLGILSKFDFEYVDHVEIYYGTTTFEFGIEPSTIVVKMYTKDPNRENGNQIKLSASSHNSKEGNISIAKVFDDFSLFAYINRKVINEDKIVFEDTPLSKDKESTHLFLSLQNENNRIEYNRIEAHSDLFMQGGDNSLLKNKGGGTYNLLGWYSTWLENKLSLSLDYIFLDSYTDEYDKEPLGYLPYPTFGPRIAVYSKYIKNKENLLSAVLKYRHKINKHNLLFGSHLRKKSFKVSEVIVNNKNLPAKLPFEGEKIYGVFLEDNYEINNNQMIVASVKLDIVSPNSNTLKNDNLLFYRLGYIYKKENFGFKTFYTSVESRFAPYYYYTDINAKLKKQKNNSIFLEFDWESYPFDHGLSLFLTKEKYRLSTYNQNTKKPYYSKGISFTNSYHFDTLNKIDTNFFIINQEDKEFNDKDTVYGGYIRLLNSINKFDLYNELIYRDGYKNLNAGYNYNTAITYNYTKDFSIFVKGENIFNKAIKTTYHKREIYPPYKEKTLGPLSISSRRFLIGMEYKF